VSVAELITIIPSLRPEVISPGNVTELEKLNILSGHSDQVSTVAFTPDGKLLASVSFYGEIKLWDVESG